MKFKSCNREFDTDHIINGTMSRWMLAFEWGGTIWTIPLWEFDEDTIEEMTEFFTKKEKK